MNSDTHERHVYPNLVPPPIDPSAPTSLHDPSPRLVPPPPPAPPPRFPPPSLPSRPSPPPLLFFFFLLLLPPFRPAPESPSARFANTTFYFSLFPLLRLFFFCCLFFFRFCCCCFSFFFSFCLRPDFLLVFNSAQRRCDVYVRVLTCSTVRGKKPKLLSPEVINWLHSARGRPTKGTVPVISSLCKHQLKALRVRPGATAS